MSRSRTLFLQAVLVVLAAGAATLASSRAEEDGPPSASEQLASLGWLAGRWEGAMSGGTFTSCYAPPAGGCLLSFSELRRDDKVVFHEFEVWRIVDGTLRMHPYPGGKPVTGFRLAALDAAARRVTFENPDKDFPTRIVYERPEGNRLVITLSDPHGGSEKQEVFDLRRVADR